MDCVILTTQVILFTLKSFSFLLVSKLMYSFEKKYLYCSHPFYIDKNSNFYCKISQSYTFNL